MFRVVFPPIIISAYNCIYSIWYLSHRYCYLTISWKSWNRFECAVGGVRHVTGGCMCSIRRLLMMGARVPETCRAESEYNRVLMILRLLCNWLVFFYSLFSSLILSNLKHELLNRLRSTMAANVLRAIITLSNFKYLIFAVCSGDEVFLFKV
jgi:hypothetical protein